MRVGRDMDAMMEVAAAARVAMAKTTTKKTP
jgi:hypothetical protein